MRLRCWTKQAALLAAAGVLATAGVLAGCQLLPAAAPPTSAHVTVLPSTPITYPTLPPEWTATWTPVPRPATPTPVRSATPAADYSQRLAAAQPQITQATKLTNAGQWATALELWNTLIPQVPEYADGYYQRVRCLLHLTAATGAQEAYEATLRQALGDMDQALALDSRNGDYLYERSVIYFDLAQLPLYRVDQDYWYGLEVADLQAAQRVGNHVAGLDRQAAFELIYAGQPQAAEDLFNSLAPEAGKTLVSDGGLQLGLAESLFALGFTDEALSHLNLALRLDPSDYATRLKALMLVSQGQPQAALTEINKLSQGGLFCTCGYYLRALIYYQLGQPDKAQADIDTGTPRTWQRGGLRSYVLGLLALDKGDTASGTALMQEAQASLPRSEGPVLLKQITQKLNALGAARLDPTAVEEATATAMPAPP